MFCTGRATRLLNPEKLATFKVFLIDEAWLFIRNETIRRYIVQAQKTWRKHNAAMILATQSIKELEESGMFEIVAESCPTKIFLANPDMDCEVYREAFHLNDTELDLIAGLVPPGQMLIRKAAVLEEGSSQRGLGIALDGYQQRPRQLEETGVFRQLRDCRRSAPSCTGLSIPATDRGRDSCQQVEEEDMHRIQLVATLAAIAISTPTMLRTGCVCPYHPISLPGHHSHSRQAEVHDTH